MRARTITVRLTETQFHELASAVDYKQTVYGDLADTRDPDASRKAAVLDRAWDALHGAWREAAR